jgi:hypothetical protein
MIKRQTEFQHYPRHGVIVAVSNRKTHCNLSFWNVVTEAVQCTWTNKIHIADPTSVDDSVDGRRG